MTGPTHRSTAPGVWAPHIDRAACTGCGRCVDACAPGALARVGGTASVAHPGACTYCAMCEPLCPAGAIALPYQIVLENPP